VACPKVEEVDRRLLKSIAGRRRTRAKSRTCVCHESAIRVIGLEWQNAGVRVLLTMSAAVPCDRGIESFEVMPYPDVGFHVGDDVVIEIHLNRNERSRHDEDSRLGQEIPIGRLPFLDGQNVFNGVRTNMKDLPTKPPVCSQPWVKRSHPSSVVLRTYSSICASGNSDLSVGRTGANRDGML